MVGCEELEHVGGAACERKRFAHHVCDSLIGRLDTERNVDELAGALLKDEVRPLGAAMLAGRHSATE